MRRFAIHTLVASLLGLFVVAEASPVCAQPRAPQGIYATIDISDYVKQNPNVTDTQFEQFYDSMLANPAISGLDIELHWDFAEPNPPPAGGLTAADLNLSFVNDAFTEAAKYGKTIKLDVTGGFNSPPWLLDYTTYPTTAIPPCDTLFTTGTAPSGCGTVTFNYYGEKTDQDTKNQVDQMLVLPLPWSSTYIAAWQALLGVLQQQYGSNPILVAVTMAGPTAASPEMIMPNNYNTCANGMPPANQGAHNLCYTCPTGTSPPCTASNGMLAEDMWNTLFQSPISDPGQLYPQNSDQAFIGQWESAIQFYEQTFRGITLTITPGAATGFPSFGSPHPFTPSSGNVLYDPECAYSNSGGSTYAQNNYETRSCDAATAILSYFMNTNGGPNADGMASQTSGMEAQEPTALGIAGDGNTGDVGVPGLKYLADYSLSIGPPQQEVIGGAQFDHQFSDSTTMQQEGCPTYPAVCSPFSAEQAEYNVLQVFFLNTPGANRFGGPAVVDDAPPSQLTPRYLEVLNQDITYAEQSTSVAQPIVDVMTGATYQLSAQDMLNMAKASLFGRFPAHGFGDDGRSDILWRNTGGVLAMWLMNGSSLFGSGNITSVGSTYSIIGQRDFTGNGNADILWRDTSGNLYMWFMNGLTMTSSASLGNVPTTWTVKGTGDMNGDGKGDLLWQDAAGDLAIWFMNGSQVSSTTSLGTVPTSAWTLAGATTSTILWHDPSHNYALWQVNGSTVQSFGLGLVPSNWVVKGFGDFNGDGVSDILWQDSNSGTVAIWFLNSSGGVLSTGTVGTVPSSTTWQITQTGDYNGDGMSDILWIDGAGNVAIWFMNGATIASTTGLGNVGTTWTVQAQNAE